MKLTFIAPRPRIVIGIILLALLCYAMFRFSVPQSQKHQFIPNDYMIFHTAVDRLQKGEAVYQASDASPFKYSPAFLIAFKLTLARLDPQKSWFIYCLLSLCAWLASLFLIFKNCIFENDILPKHFYLFLTIGLLASWHGFLEHLSYGQADFLIASFAVFSFWLYSKSLTIPSHKSRMVVLLLSGFCFASALLIKPTALLLFAGLAWSSGTALLFLGGFISICLLAMTFVHTGLVSGILLCLQWISSLGKQPSNLFGGNINQNFAVVLARDLQIVEHAENFAKVSLAIGVFVLGLCVLRSLRRSSEKLISSSEWVHPMAASMGLYLCTTPLSWRWMTFLWWPMTAVLVKRWSTSDQRNNAPHLTSKLCFAVFTVLALLLQKVVAHAIGIPEVDILSYWGLYGWGSFLLLLALII